MTDNLAWLAGLLEGEGCFSVAGYSGTKRIYPRITIHMTDLDVLEQAKALTGMGTIHQRKPRLTNLLVQPRNPKASWAWQVQRQEDAFALAAEVYPLMCSRRREQIETMFHRCQRSFTLKAGLQSNLVEVLP